MSIDHSTFVPNVSVTDGMVVVTLDKAIIWAGAVQFTPLDQVPAGAELHVHPNLLDRIRTKADQLEPGGVGGTGR